MVDITQAPDLTGSNLEYYIEDETHSMVEGGLQVTHSGTGEVVDYRFVFPYKGSMFTHNFKAYAYDPGTQAEFQLNENEHYVFALEYVGATRAALSPCYRAILIIDDSIVNSVRISYQALGGVEALNPGQILHRLSEIEYYPRTTVWDNILDVPLAFPAGIHYHESNELVYQSELIDKLNDIKDAINTSANRVASDIVDYINSL